MEEAIKKFFADHDRIFIFGIGNYSAALAERLDQLDLTFDGFIATSRSEPDRFTQMPVEHFMDHRVVLVDDHENNLWGGGRRGIILALPEKYQPDAERLLLEHGSKNFLRLSDEYMLANVRRSNELTSELVDEFKRSIPFQTVEHKPWRNILTVMQRGMGDAIMLTPFLRELKRNHPTAEITLVIAPLAFPLMQVFPYVDHVYCFDWKRNIGTLRHRMLNIKRFVDDILSDQGIDAFDAAIMPSWDYYFAGESFFTFFSRAAVRIGYSEHVTARKAEANRNFDLLFTDVIDDRTLRHEVERSLILLRHVGDIVVNERPELYVLPEDHSAVDRLLRAELDRDAKLIVLGVSATSPRRIWDRDNFSELVNRLHAMHDNLFFIILGAGDAVENAAYIVEHTPHKVVIDLTDRLTLRDSAAICTRASIYIGNNTGTMHLAAACGMRCVEINNVPNNGDPFIDDSATRTRPLGDGHIIIQPEHALDDCVGHCRKPYAHCINQITVDEVLREVQKIVE